MDNHKVLHFIAEKVEDIKIAIFYCQSNSILKINNTIVSTSTVDESGCISFFIRRPSQLISQFEQEFPVSLNYFKKGKNYFLNIFGKARMINDPEELAYHTELTPEEITSALTTHVFVRVKILKADFKDCNYEKKNMFLKKIWSIFCNLTNQLEFASGTYDLSSRSPVHNYVF